MLHDILQIGDAVQQTAVFSCYQTGIYEHPYYVNNIDDDYYYLNGVGPELKIPKESIFQCFKKAFIWSDWTRDTFIDSLGFKHNVMYKTNGKKIKMRGTGKKYRHFTSHATCHRNDTYNEAEGLALCFERLMDKIYDYEMNQNLPSCEVKTCNTFATSSVSEDLFEVPSYYCLVHAINADCQFIGLAKQIDELFNLSNLGQYELEVGQAYCERNVISLVVGENRHTSFSYGNLQKALKGLRAIVEINQIKYLAMPKLCCGRGGLNWEAVEPMLEEALSGLGVFVKICEK